MRKRNVGVGTAATSGWSVYRQPGRCELCGASDEKRTLYCAPLNQHDPDEGLFVACFLCLLANERTRHMAPLEMA